MAVSHNLRSGTKSGYELRERKVEKDFTYYESDDDDESLLAPDSWESTLKEMQIEYFPLRNSTLRLYKNGHSVLVTKVRMPHITQSGNVVFTAIFRKNNKAGIKVSYLDPVDVFHSAEIISDWMDYFKTNREKLRPNISKAIEIGIREKCMTRVPKEFKPGAIVEILEPSVLDRTDLTIEQLRAGKGQFAEVLSLNKIVYWWTLCLDTFPLYYVRHLRIDVKERKFGAHEKFDRKGYQHLSSVRLLVSKSDRDTYATDCGETAKAVLLEWNRLGRIEQIGINQNIQLFTRAKNRSKMRSFVKQAHGQLNDENRMKAHCNVTMPEMEFKYDYQPYFNSLVDGQFDKRVNYYCTILLEDFGKLASSPLAGIRVFHSKKYLLCNLRMEYNVGSEKLRMDADIVSETVTGQPIIRSEF